MAHHWLAPHLYRVFTTLGSIPCTAKPQRPLSVTLPEDPDQSKSKTIRRRSPSPFQSKDPKTELVLYEYGQKPVVIQPKDPRADIIDFSFSVSYILGVESTGQVAVWADENEQVKTPLSDSMKMSKHFEGMMGINIIQVSSGQGFLCFLTDRGLILTKGLGESGCLGHGDWRNVKSPKIIEELLGCDVIQVESGEDHVTILTSDSEVFHWGNLTDRVSNIPILVELESDIEKVVCGPNGATALITTDGRLLCRGENTVNRLFLNNGKETFEATFEFEYVLSHIENIDDISISTQHSIVITNRKEVYLSNPSGKIKQVNVSGVPAGIGTVANYVIITSEFGTVEMWQTSDLKNSKNIKTLNDSKKIKKIKVIPSDHSFYMLSYFG